MIKIETIKTRLKYKKARKIVQVTGMMQEKDLPEGYIMGVPHCFYVPDSEGSDYIIYIDKQKERRSFTVDAIYHEEYFQDIIAMIQKCGERLYIIKEKMRQEWQGTEIIEI